MLRCCAGELLLQAAAAGTAAADLPGYLSQCSIGEEVLSTEACSQALVDLLVAVGGEGRLADLLPGLAQVVGGLLRLGADPNYSGHASGLAPLSAAIRSGSSPTITLLLERGAKPVPSAALPASSPATAPADTVAPGLAPLGATIQLAVATGAVWIAPPAAAGSAGGSKKKKKKKKTKTAKRKLGEVGEEASAQQEQEQQQQQQREAWDEASAQQQQQQLQQRVAGEEASAQQQQQLQQPSQPTCQPSPLVMAVTAGNHGLVERLIASGADVNSESCFLSDGSATATVTPLIAAVRVGSDVAVGQLLTAGADVHHKCPPATAGSDWATALGAAVTAGNASLVRGLVEAGACGNRATGLMLARRHPALRAAVQAAASGRVDLLQEIYLPIVAAVEGKLPSGCGLLWTLCCCLCWQPVAPAGTCLGRLTAHS